MATGALFRRWSFMKSEVEFQLPEGADFPFIPYGEWIAVDIYDKGGGITPGGIITFTDDMKEQGIRPREARVLALGKRFDDDQVKVGDIVLIEHLGWTHKTGYFMTREGKKQDFWLTKLEKIECVIDREAK